MSFEAAMKYWINSVSFDHIQNGMSGGFTQAQHGSPSGLRRLASGDLVAFYAPRTKMYSGEPLKSFVAVAEVLDVRSYQAHMTADFQPWRRHVEFKPAHQTPIAPLLDRLAFIRDKRHWGYVFRRGLFEISERDFLLIAAAMAL